MLVSGLRLWSLQKIYVPCAKTPVQQFAVEIHIDPSQAALGSLPHSTSSKIRKLVRSELDYLSPSRVIDNRR
jgi:hypothetical protein